VGTYNLNYEEIADAMENVDVDSRCEGDYNETDFIKGAKEYIKRLRKQGAYIPK
jgi:hypothetical protein